ncbi:MAG: tRNA (N(6)-L-threonylcarbamoyladenosine(37)-C(2))-methylthiotransferase, partial [Candidatus Bathyarchaeota archaeon]
MYILMLVASLRIYVKGFGCSSSLADAEVLAGCLLNAGHSIVNSVSEADTILYNTCAVKAPTENRMIDLLKRVPKEKKLIVAGCLPLVNFGRLRREVDFDGIVGPAFAEKIIGAVNQVSEGLYVEDLEDMGSLPQIDLPRKRVNRVVSIIPICYGCLGSCSYCCVRFARGALRSYEIGEIVGKVKRDLAEGVREFWLTSQDTACYGKDRGTSLAELMNAVCDVEAKFFVRVGMMTPNNLLLIFDELMAAFDDEKVFKFMHLPVQSGDDEILGRMNRLYSVKDFVGILKRFRMRFSRSTVATDAIVGFPGETEAAFNRTCRLVESVKPDIVNVSKFFVRPGAAAGCLEPKVSSGEVKRRSTALSNVTRSLAR